MAAALHKREGIGNGVGTKRQIFTTGRRKEPWKPAAGRPTGTGLPWGLAGGTPPPDPAFTDYETA